MRIGLPTLVFAAGADLRVVGFRCPETRGGAMRTDLTIPMRPVPK